MNNTWKCALVIGGKVYVAWKRKMLHDVIGGYQAYIQRKIYLLRLEFGIWLRPRAVAWKRKMLHDVIGAYQAYIQRKIYLLRLEFGSWLRPRAVSRLRA